MPTQTRPAKQKSPDNALWLKPVIATKGLVRACFDDGKREWEVYDLEKPVQGVIVGVTFLNNGRRVPGYKGSWEYNYSDAEGPEFHKTGTVKCYLVKPGLRRKTLKVPDGGFTVVEATV